MTSTSQSLSLPPLMPTPLRQTRAAASQKARSTAPRSDATSVSVSHPQSRRPSGTRHRGRACLAQQGVDDHHRPARFKAEIHAMEALPAQGFGHLLLVLPLAVEEQEAAAAGARNLANARPGVPRRLVPLIDPGIGDAGCQLALGDPGLVEVVTERVDLAAEQVVAQRDGEGLDHMERVDHAGAVTLAAAFLLAQDLRGIA